jgi:hypothetical protein
MIDTICEIYDIKPGEFRVVVPAPNRDLVAAMLQRKKDHYYRIRIDRPRKARTTGERSQNHHINGHCQQIAIETGNDLETVKMYCKEQAISEGYPFDEFGGRAIPYSETRIDTVQAGVLIETIHRLAAELGIVLVEYPDE